MRRTRILLGCFRQGSAEDPEVYVTAVAKILSGYSSRVVMTVTDIERGLPVRSQWLPTLAELKAACEAEADQERKASIAARALPAKANFKPATPDERARAIARWERVRAELVAGAEQKAKERDYAQNEAFLDDCLAAGGLLQGVTLSPDLAETFNKDGKR